MYKIEILINRPFEKNLLRCQACLKSALDYDTNCETCNGYTFWKYLDD